MFSSRTEINYTKEDARPGKDRSGSICSSAARGRRGFDTALPAGCVFRVIGREARGEREGDDGRPRGSGRRGVDWRRLFGLLGFRGIWVRFVKFARKGLRPRLREGGLVRLVHGAG